MTTSSRVPLRKFATPEIIFGNGARLLATKYAQTLSLRHCMVVTDKGVLKAGWVSPLLEQLNETGINTTLFDSISPNPRDTEVRSGANIYLSEGCDGIITIGGGSAMDAAKGIGFMATNDQDILEFEGVDKVGIPAPPLICIPTTAGTSADISQFCIINNTLLRKKIAIVAQAAIPDIALVDPEATVTMDEELTAATGLDALTHAFEAYVSTASSPTTDLFALDAVRLVHANLHTAVFNPENMEARENMMRASMHAGLAFSNAILGAVHAMAHSLGGMMDSPHGDCNAILLPHVSRENFKTVPERYRNLAEAFSLPTKGKSDEYLQEVLFSALMEYNVRVNAPTQLRALNLDKLMIPELAATAIADACMMTNPKLLTQADVERLYEEAW